MAYDEEIDLSQYDAAFNDAQVPVSENVPDGTYVAKIDRVEFKKAKSSGRDMLHWELTILGPSHAGRKLFRNNMLDRPEWVKKDLRTCGITITRLSDLRLSDLLDVKLEVRVKTNGENSNVYLNKMVGGAGGTGGAGTTGGPALGARGAANVTGNGSNGDAGAAAGDDPLPF